MPSEINAYYATWTRLGLFITQKDSPLQAICKVSCSDFRGDQHTIEVSAGSAYEAIAQALRIFPDDEWVEE